MKIPLGYKSLRRVLNLALEQAANGKGKERHALTGHSTTSLL